MAKPTKKSRKGVSPARVRKFARKMLKSKVLKDLKRKPLRRIVPPRTENVFTPENRKTIEEWVNRSAKAEVDEFIAEVGFAPIKNTRLYSEEQLSARREYRNRKNWQHKLIAAVCIVIIAGIAIAMCYR